MIIYWLYDFGQVIHSLSYTLLICKIEIKFIMRIKTD